MDEEIDKEDSLGFSLIVPTKQTLNDFEFELEKSTSTITFFGQSKLLQQFLLTKVHKIF